MTPLVDSHCHLDFQDFAPERDAVVARAIEAGVGLMVTISTRVKQFDRVLSLVERYPNVFGTVGTHPQNAHEELDVTTDDLIRLASTPRSWASARPAWISITTPARRKRRSRAFARTSRPRARPAFRW